MTVRRGYSLIETLVAIALITTTFSTIVVTLDGMFRASRGVRGEAESQLDLERFAARFRGDAHEALSVESKQEGGESGAGTLAFALADGRTARYTIEPGGVGRVLSGGEKAEHRDTYRLPRYVAATWRLQTDRPRPIVSLVLTPKPGTGKSGPTAYQVSRVDASVGLLRSKHKK